MPTDIASLPPLQNQLGIAVRVEIAPELVPSPPWRQLADYLPNITALVKHKLRTCEAMMKNVLLGAAVRARYKASLSSTSGTASVVTVATSKKASVSWKVCNQRHPLCAPLPCYSCSSSVGTTRWNGPRTRTTSCSSNFARPSLQGCTKTRTAARTPTTRTRTKVWRWTLSSSSSPWSSCGSAPALSCTGRR